jgi:enhancer of mRNA-decapping protein 3
VEVAPTQPSTSTITTPTQAAAPQRIPSNHASTKPTTQAPFMDPAIVSYAKPTQPVSPIMIADGIVPSPISLQGRTVAKQSSISSMGTTQPSRRPTRRESEATAILTEPFDALDLSTVVQPTAANKKSNATKKHKPSPSQTAPGIIDLKDIQGSLKQTQTLTPPSTKPQKAAAAVGKGKGWRSTPLLDERAPRRRGRKANKTGEDAANNGWATEDATDIQDMPEFDFAENLSKFDKRQVFDDLRRDDMVPTDERLVSFNRVNKTPTTHKPGTNGGRNLHFTENVLDGDEADGDRWQWKSEAGETELDDVVNDPAQYSSSKGGSRRANSRRPLASRKGSAIPNHIVAERQASPRGLQRVASVANPVALNGAAAGAGSVSGLKASFRLPNNKPCQSLSPLQMLEIEQLCTSDFGMSEDMLSENAGRSIAEAVLQCRPALGAEIKTIVFLVGNHKSGARAVVAARHLRNRRLRVTVVLLGGEREESVLESVKRQIGIYKKGGGWVERWDEYQAKLGQGAPRPDVVVDALLGVHVGFDELRTDDQAVVFEMVGWAGRGTAAVMSVDVPSGVSASSGVITEVDGQAVCMRTKRVVALGAPKVGLLLAMVIGVDSADDGAAWEVVVADVGISTAAWQRHGSRRRQGVEFSGEWVVPVRFVAG